MNKVINDPSRVRKVINRQVICKPNRAKILSVKNIAGQVFSVGDVWFFREYEVKVRITNILCPVDRSEGEFRLQLMSLATNIVVANFDVENAMNFLSYINGN